MARKQADPYGPLRRELAELGYLSGEIRRVVAYHEEHGTFIGYEEMDDLEQLHCELIMETGRPMATVERTR